MRRGLELFGVSSREFAIANILLVLLLSFGCTYVGQKGDRRDGVLSEINRHGYDVGRPEIHHDLFGSFQTFHKSRFLIQLAAAGRDGGILDVWNLGSFETGGACHTSCHFCNESQVLKLAL